VEVGRYSTHWLYLEAIRVDEWGQGHVKQYEYFFEQASNPNRSLASRMEKQKRRQPFRSKERKKARLSLSRQQDATAALVKRASEPLIGLQQRLGNQMVGDLLQRVRGPGAGQEEQQEIASDTAESEGVAYSPSALRMRRELVGHGAGEVPSVQTEEEGAGDGPTATVTLTANEPNEISKPASKIAEDHGKPNLAGWVTPRADIQAPSISATEMELTVTLDFDMELAQEYTGEKLHVLRDHEQGHVNIGTRLGQKHLVDELKKNLEALGDFKSPDSVRTVFSTAMQTFTDQEAIKAQEYDDVDYPRMEQAYIGARLPLADLKKDSAEVASITKALEDFEASNADLVQAALDARAALSDDDLARLQYNVEFKELVDGARSKIEGFLKGKEEAPEAEASPEDKELLGKVKEAQAMLDDFTWKPPE